MCGNPCAVQVLVVLCNMIKDEGQIMPLRGKREKKKRKIWFDRGNSNNNRDRRWNHGAALKHRSILILSSYGEYVHSGYLDVHIPCRS